MNLLNKLTKKVNQRVIRKELERKEAQRSKFWASVSTELLKRCLSDHEEEQEKALKELQEEKAIYEFHPNASAEYGIIELDRKSNVAIVKEPLQGSEWHTVHALNKLEEYGASNLFPNNDIIYWY
nr:MAG TPA: hypothetical protein [Caudoviricetes sp.]